MLHYILNGFLLLICIALPIVLMAASNGAQPVWMSCQERRKQYGTPQNKPEGRQ